MRTQFRKTIPTLLAKNISRIPWKLFNLLFHIFDNQFICSFAQRWRNHLFTYAWANFKSTTVACVAFRSMKPTFPADEVHWACRLMRVSLEALCFWTTARAVYGEWKTCIELTRWSVGLLGKTRTFNFEHSSLAWNKSTLWTSSRSFEIRIQINSRRQ